MVAPASRFSNTADTGMRLSLNTHTPLSLHGTLSTAGHCDQSRVAMLLLSFHRIPLAKQLRRKPEGRRPASRKIGNNMTDPVEALILDLLDWLTVRDRTYEEVMGAWRTSCPRLPVWEEANDRGLIMREEANGKSMIRVSSSGLALLGQHKTLNTD